MCWGRRRTRRRGSTDHHWSYRNAKEYAGVLEYPEPEEQVYEADAEGEGRRQGSGGGGWASLSEPRGQRRCGSEKAGKVATK